MGIVIWNLYLQLHCWVVTVQLCAYGNLALLRVAAGSLRSPVATAPVQLVIK